MTEATASDVNRTPVIHTHVILGAGPVGRAVAAALNARGIEPTVITRSGTAIPGTVSRRADLTDGDAAIAAVAGATVVYQCAQPAYDRWPEEFPRLQRNAVAAAARAGAVLAVAENLYGYAPPTGPLSEVLPLDSTTRKGAVRAAMWRELEDAHQAGVVRVVAARASDFFGPGVTNSAVGDRFFKALMAGKRIQVVGDPDRLHTYTYAPDFGEALVRLSDTPTSWGSAWHVPNAPTVTTREFAALAGSIASRPAQLRRIADWQLRLVGRFVPALNEIVELLYEFQNDWVVDDSRYVALLGGHATSLEDALRATIDSLTTSSERPAGTGVKAAA